MFQTRILIEEPKKDAFEVSRICCPSAEGLLHNPITSPESHVIDMGMASTVCPTLPPLIIPGMFEGIKLTDRDIETGNRVNLKVALYHEHKLLKDPLEVHYFFNEIRHFFFFLVVVSENCVLDRF